MEGIGKMKCTKCGNEIKDDVKFCPNCGEEVKEEKKIKFCMKCGSELMPDSMFCSKCGASITGEQKKGKSPKPNKPVKKVVGVIGILVVLVLIVGCFMINSDKAMYKAYAEFHDEYCDKNLNYEEFNDCAAKIIMAPDNKKWLAILDIVNLSFDEDGDVIYDSLRTKITLYRYSWGKVKKVSSFSKDVEIWNMSGVFSLIDNELYLFTNSHSRYQPANEKGNIEDVYRLNEKNRFEAVKVKEEKKMDDDGDEYSVEYVKPGMTSGDFFWLSNCRYLDDYTDIRDSQLLFTNSIISTEVNEFADVVKELSKYKIKNQDDLQIAYGKIFKDFGLVDEAYEIDGLLSSDYPVVGTMKTEYGYYYVRTSGNVALNGLIENGDLDKALKSADGRKVTGIDGVYNDDIPENFKIPDNITYIGGGAFSGCESLQQIEIPDSVEKIGGGAFSGCESLQQIEIPDSVEKIDGGAFSGCESLQQIEIPDSVEKIGEDIFEYIDFPPIIIASEGSYAHQYAEENDLEWSAKELSKEELEERKLISEALNAYVGYIENYKSSDKEYKGEKYDGVSLGYVNDDNIPECFMWKNYSYPPLGLTLLSFVNGKVISQDIDIYGNYEECTYTPRSGRLCGEYLLRGLGIEYKIYNLTDKFEIISTAHNFWGSWGNEEYSVNGENYGSGEAVEEYITSLGFNDLFSGDDVYDSVYSAYENMNKVN